MKYEWKYLDDNRPNAWRKSAITGIDHFPDLTYWFNLFGFVLYENYAVRHKKVK